MKKVLKSSLSVLLAITMIFSSAYVGLSEVDFGEIFAVKTHAASEGNLSFILNDDGKSYSVKGIYNTYSGEIDIPSSYNGLPVTSLAVNAFDGFKNLTSITIPNSVTSIKKFAFYGCDSLVSVTIPNSVTTLADSVFYHCDNLISVNLPKSITSIGKYSFGYCMNLNSITLPSGLTAIKEGLFYCCYDLKNVNIPDEVTEIGANAFYCCYSLEKINIPNSVTRIGERAFCHCIELKSITIPAVERIYRETFYRCMKLESVFIKNGVTSISDKAFAFCDNLKYVAISGTVTDIDLNSFEGSGDFTMYCPPSSYAQTYASFCKIPYENAYDFGSLEFYKKERTVTTFSIYNKDFYFKGDALGIVSGKTNGAVKEASLVCGTYKESFSSGLKENSAYIVLYDLQNEAVISREGFQNYIIPIEVINNFKHTGPETVNVYMKTNNPNDSIYVSTVFGRTHDDDNVNVYNELQSQSLELTPEKRYDVIISAVNPGNEELTYVLSQDSKHKISNDTGVFLEADLYNTFVIDSPIYAYVKTSSGQVSDAIPINMTKIFYSETATKLLSSPTFSLGVASDKIVIDEGIPVIGGAEFSCGFLNFPQKVQIKGNKVRIAFGIDSLEVFGEDDDGQWSVFKKACKEIDGIMTGKTGDNQVDELNKAFNKYLADPPGKMNFGVNATALGYIEGYIVDGDIVFTDFCGTMAAEFITQYTYNTFIGYVPVYVYVQGGVKGAAEIHLLRTFPDKDTPLELQTTLSFTPKLKVGGGVGAEGIVSAGVYGKVEAPFSFELPDKHLTLDVKGSVGVEAELLGLLSSDLELFSGEFSAIDTYLVLPKENLGDFSETVLSEMAALSYSNNSGNNKYTVANRDYVSSTSGWLGCVADSNSSEVFYEQMPLYNSGNVSNTTVRELQTSVYKNSQIQFIEFGDKLMLAYIEDCAERDTHNRYRLMYTVYDHVNNTWTQPKAVCDSGKMDVSPYLATDGENVYIAWQTVNVKLTEATDAAMNDAIKNMEIYSAKYDSATDSFVNVTQHTSNDTYDYSPYVTVENGEATVYWVNAGSINFAPGTMSIHSSANSDNTLVYDDMNYIVSLKASGSSLSYSIDCDGDLTTVSDIKLFTDGVQVGKGVVGDTAVITNFAYADFNGKETLFYSDGGTVYYVENGTSIEAFTDNSGIADSIDVTSLNGKSAIIYTQLTDTGSELRISTLDNGEWSKPVFLTDIGYSLSNVDVASVNGKLYAVFDRTETTEITDDVTGDTYLSYGQTDLCMLSSTGYYDLEISSVYYEEGDVSVGSSSPFIVVVENKGTEKISSISFVVEDSLGYLQTVTKQVDLAPGAIERIELEYVAQEGYSACDLTVSGTIVGHNDVDTTNNSTTEKIGRTDISVGEISIERVGDVYSFSCVVTNNSLIDAENVIVNISYFACEREIEIGTMEAGSSYVVELVMAKQELVFDENDICTLTYRISTESEELVLGDNENKVTVADTERLQEHKHNFIDNICDVCTVEAFKFEVVEQNGIDIGYMISDCITEYEGEVVVPETYNNLPVTIIGTDAFRDCASITSVVIPESVKSIGGSAFRNCTNLGKIVLPDNITSIPGAMCLGCTKLETMVIPDGVINIGGYAFSGCTTLKYVVIPDSVTNIGASVFTNCSSLIIICEESSSGNTYADNNNIPYILKTSNTNFDFESMVICTDILGAKLNGIISSSANVSCSMNKTNAGTGSVITIKKNNTVYPEFTLVVTGDTNGDSVCDVLDCAQVELASNGNAELSGVYAMAADSNLDDMVDIADYQAIVNRALAS